MKVTKALFERLKKEDSTPQERYEYSKIRAELENCCEKYLSSSDDILTFEVVPNAIDQILEILGSESFLEKYEFEQISDVLYRVKLREVDMLF